MKKAIFHAVKRGGYSGHILEVMSVTSESFGICYGRTDTARTSCASRDIIGRFPSLEAAQAAMVRVDAVRKEHAPAIREARQVVEVLEAKLYKAIHAAAAGEPEPCQAYQVSDQMTCDVCGLTWDMNDGSPPACRKR